MICNPRSPRLVRTLDRKRADDADLGAVDTRIQPAAKTLLSPAHKVPPQGTQVREVSQAALDKLRPTNYPRVDARHAAWFPSLPVLLTASVARGSLFVSDLQLFFGKIPPPALPPYWTAGQLHRRHKLPAAPWCYGPRKSMFQAQEYSQTIGILLGLPLPPRWLKYKMKKCI